GEHGGFANLRNAFLVHLEEEEVGNLADISLIGNALVAQHMREIPNLGDEGLCVHASDLLIRPRLARRVGELAARPLRGTIARSSAGSCGTNRPSKAALRTDCLSRSASAASASSVTRVSVDA